MKEKVSFKNANLNMAGDLYLPVDMSSNKKYAAIVCVHPGGGVKEQVSGLYAGKLAEMGYVALAFDASHQGESEGEPRYLEDPAKRVEDIHSAVDYLVTLPYVDENRIGAVGICAGGGYAVSAAQTESRIKAVAGISSVNIGTFFREGLGGGVPVSVQLETLAAVGKQRTAEARGAAPVYISYVPESADGFDESTPELMREAYDYYRTPRAQHPNSSNQMLFTSCDRIMAYSAFSQIDTLLNKPLLMIAGEAADTRYFSEEAYRLAKEPKELFLVKGATHIALYDMPDFVKQVSGKLEEFFGKYL